MHFSTHDIARLTLQISAVGLNHDKWQNVLDTLGSVCGGLRTHLIGHDLEIGIDLGAPASGYDPDHLVSYRDYYAEKNVWLPGFMKAVPGVPMWTEQMCRFEDFRKTEFYNDWIRPQEDISAGGGVMLAKTPKRLFVLGGNIRRQDADFLEPSWMRLVEMLTPHFLNAFQMNRMQARHSLENFALIRTRGTPDAAFFLLSETQAVLCANRAGEAMLEQGHPVLVNGRGRLSFAGTGGADFQRAVRSIWNPRVYVPQPFETRAQGDDKGFQCHLSIVDVADLEDSFIGLMMGPNERGLVLTIVRKETDDSVEKALMEQFGLTARESGVARRIASGRSPQEISEEFGTSIHTVRTQIRAIKAKLKVRRQSDIVRAVGSCRQG